VSGQVTTKFRAEHRRLEAAVDRTGLTEREILSDQLVNPFASPGSRIQKLLPRRMGDPKITDAERNRLMARIGEVQRKMLEDMTKAVQTDPASLNKKQDDFGCGSLRLYPSKGGVVEGSFDCGKNFNGGELKVAGTMTQVR
jgi:hypothetical protein